MPLSSRRPARRVRDYHLQELLGKGAFGCVHQVKKGDGERLFAMKELPMDAVSAAPHRIASASHSIASHSTAFSRTGGHVSLLCQVSAAGSGGEDGLAKLLEREVQILSSLQHPNIIRYFDSFTQDGARS